VEKRELIALAKAKGRGYYYVWKNSDGSAVFQKKLEKGFYVIRVLPASFTNGDFEFQCEHDITDQNKVRGKAISNRDRYLTWGK
jgi:hypothetical protein